MRAVDANVVVRLLTTEPWCCRIRLPLQHWLASAAAPSMAGLIAWFSILLVGCGGQVDWGPDREALFVTATSGSTQHDHSCQHVRDEEFSLHNGLLTKSQADALHARIADADVSDVQRCLAEVQAYNECFLALPCDAFSDRPVPAWLLGADAAPCACGVVAMPFAGPLPATLNDCTAILPVAVAPPRLGVTCPD